MILAARITIPIAALLLATGTGHAGEGDFTCGKPGPKSDSYFVGHAKLEKQDTKDALLTIEISMSNNRERPLIHDIIIRHNNYTGKMTINGKRCRQEP